VASSEKAAAMTDPIPHQLKSLATKWTIERLPAAWLFTCRACGDEYECTCFPSGALRRGSSTTSAITGIRASTWGCGDERAAMTDLLLMVLVVGAVVLALGVDLAAAVAWLRRRWR
jgi:hypothetical protein